MVVKIRLPDGSALHEPPYTKAEEDELYRQMGNITAVYRGGARKEQRSPSQQSPAREESPKPQGKK
jgi:hypothetical protein